MGDGRLLALVGDQRSKEAELFHVDEETQEAGLISRVSHRFPGSIALLPSGEILLTARSGLIKVDPSTKRETLLEFGGMPCGVAVSASGEVWLTNGALIRGSIDKSDWTVSAVPSFDRIAIVPPLTTLPSHVEVPARRALVRREAAIRATPSDESEFLRVAHSNEFLHLGKRSGLWREVFHRDLEHGITHGWVEEEAIMSWVEPQQPIVR
jgi:hypothetical protein